MKNIREIYIFLKKLFFYLFDLLIIKTPINATKKNETILLIRLDNIGDFILWIESAREIKKYYLNNKIILICDISVYPLARESKIFDKVLPVNTSKFEKDFFYRLKYIDLIKKLNSLLAINPTYSRVLLRGDSLVRASRAKFRIGYDCDLSNITKFEKRISDSWYTTLVKSSKNDIHELEKNTKFNLNLGFKKNTKIKLANLNFIKVKDKLIKKISKIKYIVINPGSSVSFKRWPIENFAFLANKLKIKYDLGIILVGSKKENEIAKNLFDQLIGDQKYNFTGHTNLNEYIYLIKNAQLLLSNDSSGIHIATAVNTQSICILDWDDVPRGRFIPYPKKINGKKPICIFREGKKIKEMINPEIVLKYCINYLDSELKNKF